MTRGHSLIATLITEIDRYLEGVGGPAVTQVREGIGKANLGYIESMMGREPDCGHLNEALSAAKGAGRLVEAISAARSGLNWSTYDAYPRSDIGPRFPRAHAFCSLVGEDAPVFAEDFEVGLFLVAPGVLYRDHHHAAPELYAPITGPHRWRFEPDGPWVELQAHEPVWNEPWEVHATLTGRDPFLCVFGWTRDVNIPARLVFANDWNVIEAAL